MNIGDKEKEAYIAQMSEDRKTIYGRNGRFEKRCDGNRNSDFWSLLQGIENVDDDMRRELMKVLQENI